MKTWQLALIMYAIYTHSSLTKRFSDIASILWFLIAVVSFASELLK